MPSWIIEKTKLFDEKFDKLIPDNLKSGVLKQILKLGENPYASKPLGFDFFREKKIKKWRLYFLVYETRLVVYFIDVSDKKMQPKTINWIKSGLIGFKTEIESKYGLI